MNGNTRIVKKLLLAGADKDIIGKDNKTAAMIAEENDYMNIHEMLTKRNNIFITYYNIK